MKIRGAAIRLSVFACVGALFAGLLYLTLGESTLGGSHTYRAVMVDVSGLEGGDVVRVAGVRVGQVDGLDVISGNRVEVRFHVDEDQAVTDQTHVHVRYENLLGDRYLELGQPAGAGAELEEGSTIPAERTTPALDLDTLLNGFRPLFVGLSPSEINQLSGQVVQVLQGQQSAVAALVDHVASVTTTIGGREELIGQVIGNLNDVMGSLDESSGSVGAVIDGLDDLVVGLDKQDSQVLDAAAQIDVLARDTATLLARARGDARHDLAALTVAAQGINKNAGTLEKVLAALPVHYRTLQNTSSYGNFYNSFFCGLRVQTDLGLSPWLYSDAKRCER